MSQVLVIESSARQQGSVSRQLTQRFIQQWKNRRPGDQIVQRDLALAPLPHLDETLLSSWMLPLAEQNQQQREALARADEVTDELLAADVLVLAAPMYNLSIPSTLKAWIDHVLRAGRTFKYTEHGAQGLLTEKRAVVLTARGGLHSGAPSDQQEPYLRQVLAFIGITDVQFIHAEGLNMGAELAGQGVQKAEQQLAALH